MRENDTEHDTTLAQHYLDYFAVVLSVSRDVFEIVLSKCSVLCEVLLSASSASVRMGGREIVCVRKSVESEKCYVQSSVECEKCCR
jgi:hypothetical protein